LRERAPDREDLHRQVAFLDDDARPRGIHDGAFLNKLVRSPDKRGQHRDRTRAKRHRHARQAKNARFGVKAKRPNFINCAHAMALRKKVQTVAVELQGPNRQSAYMSSESQEVQL